MIEALEVRRALVAVADKAGVADLGRRLAALSVEIVSTGGTALALREAAVPVTAVADVTRFPELLDGRVKTLHPNIHAGLLADKSKPDHIGALEEHGIAPFDLVVVNLYPFREAVAAGAAEPEIVEEIDIGGPAMVRAAAKNFGSVAIIVEPHRYESVLKELEETGAISLTTRRELAREGFDHTADYDAAIADWFAATETVAGTELRTEGDGRPPEESPLPARLRLHLVRDSTLRYGENPHQRGALYLAHARGTGRVPGPLGDARVLQGKEMSFNNWLDVEAARGLCGLFAADRPAAVIVKHHNPCGVAIAETLAEAYRRALASDPVSAFGGIVAFNREVDAAAAAAMGEVFTEVVIAPAFSLEALEAFGSRKNLRVVAAPPPSPAGIDIRHVEGGALVQDADTVPEEATDMHVVTRVAPSRRQWEDLLFAWKVAARVKSNAIVLARDLATVGIGAGQMNRLTSVDLAARHAGERSRGSCLASDAFFPFRDGVDRAAEAGVAAIVHPGGSIRDDEVIAAADEHALAMVVTGRRHFRH